MNQEELLKSQIVKVIKVSKNPFDLLEHNESNAIHFDIVDESNTSNKKPFIICNSNITEIENHVKTQNNLKKKTFSSHKSFFRKSVCLAKNRQYLKKTLTEKQ